MTTLDQRIARLEAESEIRQLIARYSFAIDDHDLSATLALFTTDAVLGTVDGALGAQGMDGLSDYFRMRFAATGPANHVTHDIAIDVLNADEACGRVSAHSELWRDGKMVVTAFRYADRYRREEGGWRFAERLVSYLYYVPVDAYPGVLANRHRVHTQHPPKIADYPEPFPELAEDSPS
jgi:uncharacterized protein (TIGR02246 family)